MAVVTAHWPPIGRPLAAQWRQGALDKVGVEIALPMSGIPADQAPCLIKDFGYHLIRVGADFRPRRIARSVTSPCRPHLTHRHSVNWSKATQRT
jgi:hypothetical protein